jgi:hypothetical protein
MIAAIIYYLRADPVDESFHVSLFLFDSLGRGRIHPSHGVANRQPPMA